MSFGGGYDEQFVDTPSDHLKCAVCCHVLKDPIQIMSCGHRYCSVCFKQIKTYSQHLKSPLICPVDREEIDMAQVFNDKAVARMICDLKVKCSFQQDGCQWIGELRNLDSHKTSCQYVKPTTTTTSLNDDHVMLMKEMCNRMDKCEEMLHEKEKEISHMKLLLHQTNDKVDKRDGEISQLRKTTERMEKEIMLLKETNRTLQENVNTTMLKCENNCLTNKTELMRLDKVVEKIQCIDEEEVNSLKLEVEEVNKELAEMKISVDSAKETTRKTLENDLQHVHNELKKIRTENSNEKALVEGLQGQGPGLVESVSSIKDQVQNVVEKLCNVEETMKKESQASVEEIFRELDIVRGQQLCVDSLFRMNKPPLRCTRFTWRIDGFKERWEARKLFESQKFFSLPDGHLCQLVCSFQPFDSKDMGIFFRLFRGRNTPDTAFEASIMFDLMYNDGQKKSSPITLEEVKSRQSESFTLKAGDNYTAGWGPSKFFEGSKFDEYVENNTCVVICTVTPAS